MNQVSSSHSPPPWRAIRQRVAPEMRLRTWFFTIPSVRPYMGGR